MRALPLRPHGVQGNCDDPLTCETLVYNLRFLTQVLYRNLRRLSWYVVSTRQGNSHES